MAQIICFKEGHKDIFTRHIITKHGWRPAHKWEVPLEDLTFTDDKGIKHNANEIFRIGINDKSLFIYIYTLGDDNCELTDPPDNVCVKVTDKNEISKVLGYLANNKCNKGC